MREGGLRGGLCPEDGVGGAALAAQCWDSPPCRPALRRQRLPRSAARGLAGLMLSSRQVESEQQQEHEAQRLQEHLALLLGALLGAARPPGDGHPLLGQAEGAWEASTPSRVAELLQRCEALERKTATFENIVCVLNREVERVAVTAEACGRQHRLDQDRIEALSNKVRAGGGVRPAVPRPPHTGRGPRGVQARAGGWRLGVRQAPCSTSACAELPWTPRPTGQSSAGVQPQQDPGVPSGWMALVRETEREMGRPSFGEQGP